MTECDGGQHFESLPDEMAVHVLSFVDADTLLNCRIVCAQWRALVDAYAFQEKAAREHGSCHQRSWLLQFLANRHERCEKAGPPVVRFLCDMQTRPVQQESVEKPLWPR